MPDAPRVAAGATAATPGAADGQASRHVRALVVQAVEAAAELIGSDAVARRWSEPSALDGMTVGALCAHLVRAAGSVLAYLDRTPQPQAPPQPESLLTPVSYFHAAIDSPIHGRIKEVSADEASIGAREMAERCHQLVVNLRARLEQEPRDRVLNALGGRPLSLDDFCRTRLIEVLLHLDDLASSVGVARPAVHPDGPAIVIGILVDIARDRFGDWEVINALAREERRTERVFPVL
jgi:hypothetical protein